MIDHPLVMVPPPGPKVAIVGSRPEVVRLGDTRQANYFECRDRDRRRRAAIGIFVERLHEDVVIVSGGAPGADSWAAEAAECYGFARDILHPRWRGRDGKKRPLAGFERNQRIAAYADRVFAFYGAGTSVGTDDCVARFLRLGKPVELFDHTGARVGRPFLPEGVRGGKS